jgi:Fe-S-cluster containining protein
MKTYTISFKAVNQSQPEVNVPCGECNKCCSLSPLLTPEEFESGKYVYTFMKTEFDEGPVVAIPRNKNGCIYLIDGKCSIYDDRPMSCRIFDCRNTIFEKYKKIAEEKFKDGVHKLS